LKPGYFFALTHREANPSNDHDATRAPRSAHRSRPLRRPSQQWPRDGVPLVFPSFAPPSSDMAKTTGREAIGDESWLAGTVTNERAPGCRATISNLGRPTHRALLVRPRQPRKPRSIRTFAVLAAWFTETKGVRFRDASSRERPVEKSFHAGGRITSLFTIGAGYASRLITQMYFPGDPLLAIDRSTIRFRCSARGRSYPPSTSNVDHAEDALGLPFRHRLAAPRPTPFEDGAS